MIKLHVHVLCCNEERFRNASLLVTLQTLLHNTLHPAGTRTWWQLAMTRMKQRWAGCERQRCRERQRWAKNWREEREKWADREQRDGAGKLKINFHRAPFTFKEQLISRQRFTFAFQVQRQRVSYACRPVSSLRSYSWSPFVWAEDWLLKISWSCMQ